MDQQAVAAQKTVEWWLKEGAVYGLAFIFTACVLLLLLWVAIVAIRTLKYWAPRWFQSSIASHEKVCAACDTIIEKLTCVHDRSHETHDGLRRTIKAVNQHLSSKANQDRLGVTSDIVYQLRMAEQSMREDDEWRSVRDAE